MGWVEALESRTLLAGNVIAEVVDGSLIIRSRVTSMSEASSAETVMIWGDPDHEGRVQVNAPFATSDQIVDESDEMRVFEGVTGDVRTRLGEGRDSLSIADLKIGGRVLFRGCTGDANDFLIMTQCQIGGGVIARLGDGDDSFVASYTEINGDLQVDSGSGDDQFLFETWAKGTTITGSVTLLGGAGADQWTAENLAVSGLVRFDGGRGNDRASIESSTFAGGLDVSMGTGDDVLGLLGSQCRRKTILHADEGDDVLTSDHTRLGELSMYGGAGNDTLTLFNCTARRQSLWGGAGVNRIQREVPSLIYDFNDGLQGWQGGFADYPEGDEEYFELEQGLRPLPASVDANRQAYYMHGNDLSDDLMMYLKRQVEPGEGIVAGQRYLLLFHVTFASAVGRIPVGLFVGGKTNEPVVEARQDTHYAYLFMPDIATYTSKASGVGSVYVEEHDHDKVFVAIRQSHMHPMAVTADDTARLWLMAEFDSGSEAELAFYFMRIRVTFVPLAEPSVA
jgi:hypothetical protein